MIMKTISTRMTSWTAGALFVSWGTSLGLSYVSLGSYALLVALSIALVKAVLVALFFMELAVERYSVNVTLVAAVAMLVALIAFMVMDVLTRTPALV